MTIVRKHFGNQRFPLGPLPIVSQVGAYIMSKPGVVAGWCHEALVLEHVILLAFRGATQFPGFRPLHFVPTTRAKGARELQVANPAPTIQLADSLAWSHQVFLIIRL